MSGDETFFVYVVELRSLSGSPEVYVGSSAIRPEERFRKHKTERFGSKHVRRRGVRLLPRLYAHLNPIASRKIAQKIEKQLRRDLEKRGYEVYGACNSGESLSCSPRI